MIKINDVNVTQSSHLSLELDKLLQRQDANSALRFYLNEHQYFTNKASWEWQLAKLILSTENIDFSPSSWPQTLLSRISGSTLAFAVAQLTNNPQPLPEGLKDLGVIPVGFKPLLAKVWSNNPECAQFDSVDMKNRFAHWLGTEPQALAPTLLALTKLNETGAFDELIGEFGNKWLKVGLASTQTAEYITRFYPLDLLREIALQALNDSLVLFFDDTETLLLLLQTAFNFDNCQGELYSTIISYSQLLAARQINDEQAQIVFSIRLATLAQNEQNIEKIALEYAEHFLHNDRPFPYPEKIIYPLHLSGKAHLEEHLLQTAKFTNETPKWASLWQAQVLQLKPTRDIFEEWLAVYYCQGQLDQEHLLVGFTRSLLALPTRRNEYRDSTKGIWTHLTNGDSQVSILAKCFLVLLSPMDEDLIVEFEQQLLDAPLRNRFVKEAATEYISALRRTKKYDQLSAFLQKPSSATLRTTTSFEDYHFIKTMADITIEFPENEAQLYYWLALWEKLICLPLNNDMLIAALAHFENLRNSFKQNSTLAQLVFNQNVDRDLYLQIRRRAKAQAELTLQEKQHQLADDRVNELRKQLRHTDITATRLILEQLSG